MNIREKDLFLAALSVPAAARREFLTRECSDPGLRDRVLDLLRHHEQMHRHFLESGTALEPRNAPTQIGNYAIRRRIGRGGMGVVYLAEDMKLHRNVAVKILPPGLTTPQSERRFEIEGQILAQLNHDSIVPIYQCIERDGIRGIVMEYVEGETIDRWIARQRSKQTGDLAERGVRNKNSRLLSGFHQSIVETFLALASALEHAHLKGIVHRDIKPSNVLIGMDDRPRLMDFGVARLVGAETQTNTGEIPGTIAYMSPEQVAGDKVDALTDVFSFGVLLYEALTGRRPFIGETASETMAAIRHKPPPFPRQLDPTIGRNLEAVCLKLIEKRREDRYPSAAHIAADMSSLLRGEPILANPLTRARRIGRFVYGNRRMALGVALVMACAALTGLLWWQYAAARQRLGVLVLAADLAGVKLRAIRSETLAPGDAVVLAPTTREHYLNPGAYRVVLRDKGQQVRETAVVLMAGRATRLTFEPVTPPQQRTAMLFVPAGEYLCGAAERAGAQALRTEHVEAYYIDSTETSNAEYRAFVIDTGHAQPPHWREFGYDELLSDRPVVGVTWDDANEYARWAGKRLPTPVEWEIAMRMPDDRLLPWGEGIPTDRPIVSLNDAERMAVGDLRVAYDSYIAFTLPVSAGPTLHTPLGMCHGATNVSEYTEAVLLGDFSQVVIKGASWTCEPEFFDFVHYRTTPYLTIGFDGTQTPSWSMAIGFRCAQSAN